MAKPNPFAKAPKGKGSPKDEMPAGKGGKMPFAPFPKKSSKKK